MLDVKILNVLVCPTCNINVIYRRVGKHEELICHTCGEVFPITNNIPDMTLKTIKRSS